MTDKRKAVTHIYWTDDEKILVESHARRAGVPLAIYLRSLALADVAKSQGEQEGNKQDRSKPTKAK